MVIIELTYKKPLNMVNQFIEPHVDFLQKYYDQNIFLASGPKEPRDGGIIIAFVDKKRAKDIIKEDPFYKEDIADYRIIQFIPKKHHEKIRSLLT